MKLVPDFVCIGAQKCGTTWLYNQLKDSKAVCIPYKECNHLIKEDPVKEYEIFYRDVLTSSLLGDISPFYATQEHAADVLHHLNPDAKVIFLIRDPVDRAFSQYRMATKKLNIDPSISFLSAFKANLQFIRRRGEYLNIYHEYISAGFASKNLLLVDFRLIGQQPGRVIKVISDFLEVKITPTQKANKVFASATGKARPNKQDEEIIRDYYNRTNKGLAAYAPWCSDWIK